MTLSLTKIAIVVAGAVCFGIWKKDISAGLFCASALWLVGGV